MKKLILALFSISILIGASSSWAGWQEDIQGGLEAQKQQNFDEAIRLFTRAINSGRLSTKNLMAVHSMRGNTYAAKGLYDLAIEDQTAAIKFYANYKCYMNRAVTYAMKGLYNKAIEDFSKAIELNPKDADIYYGRGNLYRKKGLYENAVSDYTKAIELNPNHAFAYGNRGLAYEKLGKDELGRQDRAKARELGAKLGKKVVIK